MSLPSLRPTSARPADPDPLAAPRPGLGATDLARLARLFAARGILLVQGPLPPIEVYQVGEIYFVRDGNHRVSVTGQQGMKFIAALIVAVQTAVPLACDADRLELLRMAEYAQFLKATNLRQLRPGTKIRLAELGGYDQLLDHIQGHQWFLGTEYGRPFSWEEAVQSPWRSSAQRGSRAGPGHRWCSKGQRRVIHDGNTPADGASALRCVRGIPAPGGAGRRYPGRRGGGVWAVGRESGDQPQLWPRLVQPKSCATVGP